MTEYPTREALDDVPGLHYPDAEPEPKPTAAEVLADAHYQAHVRDLGVLALVLDVARIYALERPQWFALWHMHTLDGPSGALIYAANEAQRAGDDIANHVLRAASRVADANPYLFGGAK